MQRRVCVCVCVCARAHNEHCTCVDCAHDHTLLSPPYWQTGGPGNGWRPLFQR